MEPAGKQIVITGAAGGIGRALARRFAEESPRALVLADRDLAGGERIAEQVGGMAVELDAGSEASVRNLIETATQANGPIDIFISNAGVPGAMGGPEADDAACGGSSATPGPRHRHPEREPISEPAAPRGERPVQHNPPPCASQGLAQRRSPIGDSQPCCQN